MSDVKSVCAECPRVPVIIIIIIVVVIIIIIRAAGRVRGVSTGVLE